MPERILPCYVVCDQSYSMADHLHALNDRLARLHGAIGTDPVIADRTRLCLIGFSGTAEVLQPLCRLGDVVSLVELVGRVGTSFGAVFTLLRDTIEKDVDRLLADAHRVYRPVVFFLSDGHATDRGSWPAAYDRLVDREWQARPSIISFGIGDADATTIARIGTCQAFVSHGGASSASVLHGFSRALTTSVVRPADPAGAALVLRIPNQPAGCTELRIETVPAGSR